MPTFLIYSRNSRRLRPLSHYDVNHRSRRPVLARTLPWFHRPINLHRFPRTALMVRPVRFATSLMETERTATPLLVWPLRSERETLLHESRGENCRHTADLVFAEGRGRRCVRAVAGRRPGQARLHRRGNAVATVVGTAGRKALRDQDRGKHKIGEAGGPICGMGQDCA